MRRAYSKMKRKVFYFLCQDVCVREGNINKSNADKRPQKDKG